jgi:hypothetical protein
MGPRDWPLWRQLIDAATRVDAELQAILGRADLTDNLTNVKPIQASEGGL